MTYDIMSGANYICADAHGNQPKAHDVVDFTGKDLKGRALGVGICRRKDELYTARFV